jgi:hypothetical protein
MDLEQIAKDWNNSGLVIIPAFLDRSEIAELRICDHILQEAIEVCLPQRWTDRDTEGWEHGLHDGYSRARASCWLRC